MELNKKANAVNIVSAPSLTATMDHAFTRQDPTRRVSRVVAAVGVDLTGGLEFGSNVRNQYAVANKSTAGEGGFFRFVPAAAGYMVVPDVLHLSKIAFTSSHTLRIPTTDELFIETRGTQTPVPTLSGRNRYYVENTLLFMLTDYVGVKVAHKYGSVPPAFSLVQNSGSVGLVIAFKQTRVGG